MAVDFSKPISSNRNTLDSFVIRRNPSQQSEVPILKNETKKTPKKTTTKRTQNSIEDYMVKETKSSGKRFKK